MGVSVVVQRSARGHGAVDRLGSDRVSDMHNTRATAVDLDGTGFAELERTVIGADTAPGCHRHLDPRRPGIDGSVLHGGGRRARGSGGRIMPLRRGCGKGPGAARQGSPWTVTPSAASSVPVMPQPPKLSETATHSSLRPAFSGSGTSSNRPIVPR